MASPVRVPRWTEVERTLLLACVGIAAEVVFTAVTVPTQGWRLIGYSYVWMLPIYGLLYPGYRIILPRMNGIPWYARASLYAIGIMFGELLTGLMLRFLVGEAPWEAAYRGHRFCIFGLVRLDYFPAWAAAGMLFERAYRLLSPRPSGQ